MKITDLVSTLRMVGPIYAKRLEKLGIFTVEDLIFYFPFRYDDFSLTSPISRVQPGETITVTGQVEKIENSYTKTGKKIQTASISDNSGKIEIIWFNQPFLIKTIKTGEAYNFSGKCDWFGNRMALLSPEYERVPISNFQFQISNCTHTGRLVPVYPETYGISSKWLRSRIKTVLQFLSSQIEEFLPQEIISKESLLSEMQAIKEIHFPQNKISLEKAKYRLSFDELFLIQLSGLLRKSRWQKNILPKKFIVEKDKTEQFIKNLPFELTNAQERCTEEILNDIVSETPMNRLLQGDVGSGKTVVAAIAAYATLLNDKNTLFMAPTEILANQHYMTLKSLFNSPNIPIELITGSRKPKNQKSKIKNQNNNKTMKQLNNSKIVIGTHALLYQNFDPEKVGLVIIDEQHRFGVEQRSILSKKGVCPHLLTMTATPIPRTIALTLFGDLDMSFINEMPKGRIPVKTWVVPKEKRDKGYQWIRSRIKDTPEQAFIICPLIEESESLKDVKAVTQEFEILSKKIFPDLKLGLLHGRIKSKQKAKIINDFKEGKLDILVATPVVEVGIDIPNATIILIEAAERFGLAQLHQLRGRVGRRSKQSYCFLFTESSEEKTLNRLKIMEKINIGIELAESDLKLRGPGEIYGTKQHGFPDLKLADFTNLELIQKTRSFAQSITSIGEILKKKLEKYKMTSINN